MDNSTSFEFEDLQALLRFGHGRLTDTCFMLLNIVDAGAAIKWLSEAPISNARSSSPPPDTAMQIAFSVNGLRALGVDESVIDGFSDEYITGMAGDESRSRRLGDIGTNATEHWNWGGDPDEVPHVLLLLYATSGSVEAWWETLEDEVFQSAFTLINVLPTDEIGMVEPFGFADGISQPNIDWQDQQSTDMLQRDEYSNWLAIGEVVLGYPNEYGLYTTRPLIDPQADSNAHLLPDAEDDPALKDLGRNGTYLVIRQLQQDVPGFWRFVDQATDFVPQMREQLAASMVGRQRDGTPLVHSSSDKIPGITGEESSNNFDYKLDPIGHRCPIGSHIRRANPRTGDFPPGITGFFSRLIKIFGFGQKRPDEDLIASTRFHRLLRRGRAYGSVLTPEEAINPDAPIEERGLQFISLVANISRQFEFVQNAWMMSSKFAGVQQERDPLLGTRQELLNGDDTDCFNHPSPSGPTHKSCQLPEFITVIGGGYFFMPGIRALQYIAAASTKDVGEQP